MTKTKTKCPCCKVLNALREAIKHPSMESVGNYERCVKLLDDTERTVATIAQCGKHGTGEGLTGFWGEFDEGRAELKAVGAGMLAKARG